MMLWEHIVEKTETMGVPIKHVFQEEMQKAVLTALAISGCFNNIVFQGGTALRLFYGNPRFSEDIDLVLKEGNEDYDLTILLPKMKQFVHNTFPFLDLVDVKAQKDKPDLQRLILTARSNDPDQKLRLHIELAYIPSYRNTPKILDFPPIQPVVSVEEPLEILADKVCALALRSYLKGRDLWDIYYLYKERSIDIKWELVQRKVHDNKIPVSELKERFEKVNVKIKDEGSSILVNELERFLPKHVLDQYRSSFDLILDTVVELVSHYDLDKME